MTIVLPDTTRSGSTTSAPTRQVRGISARAQDSYGAASHPGIDADVGHLRSRRERDQASTQRKVHRRIDAANGAIDVGQEALHTVLVGRGAHDNARAVGGGKP